MLDWKYAGIAALLLLGLAAFIVFVIHPGGFEGQIAWLFGLLPGAFLGALIAAPLAKVAPSILVWPFVLCTSFLWYFALSYVLIKSYRLVSWFSKRR